MAIFPQSVANARANFLSKGTPGFRPLGVYDIALGETSRVKLDPLGLVTSLLVEVTVNINISGAVAEISPQSPYNIIERVNLKDSNNIDRIICPGFHLWALNCVRARSLEFRNTGVFYSIPFVPTGLGNRTIRFYLNVPVAYSDTDLRGALRMDNIGETYCDFDWSDSLFEAGNSDRCYDGAGASSVTFLSGTLRVFQRYWTSSEVLPASDVNTIHYIEGGLRISDGLVVNSERLINYPTQRRVISTFLTYVNNGTMSAADVSSIRLIAGPSELFSFTADQMYAIQLDTLQGAALPENFFFVRHEKEIATPFVRANQIGITPASVGAPGTNTYVGVTFESFG